MRIDLNRIPRDGPYAIHIPSLEHGRVFLDEMRACYPDAVSTWDDAYYMKHRLAYGGNYYYPRLHKKYPHMSHGDRITYIDMGLKFLSFDDILVPEVELNTVLGDMTIESLFA